MKKWFIVGVLAVVFFAVLAQNVMSVSAASEKPVSVEVGVLLVSVDKVDLSYSNYRLDFYLWFNYNPSEISLSEVQQFEFVNGAPTIYVVDVNETQGYLEYRVRGDFISSFDFSRYPFETHELTVKIENKNLNVADLVFEQDLSSQIDPQASVAGWNLRGFQTAVTEHSYGKETFSRFVFSIDLERPLLSSFIKTVVPLAVITTISLLAFFMAPQNFAQRITLGVTTLLAATTFHLSLINGIPPTGYLTFADRMMLSVYAIFLYNLASSVYIMRRVDSKRIEEALGAKRKALRFSPVLIIVLLIVQVLL